MFYSLRDKIKAYSKPTIMGIEYLVKDPPHVISVLRAIMKIQYPHRRDEEVRSKMNGELYNWSAKVIEFFTPRPKLLHRLVKLEDGSKCYLSGKPIGAVAFLLDTKHAMRLPEDKRPHDNTGIGAACMGLLGYMTVIEAISRETGNSVFNFLEEKERGETIDYRYAYMEAPGLPVALKFFENV
jgi:hypothetical protein